MGLDFLNIYTKQSDNVDHEGEEKNILKAI
jgi:hypothetical protein